MIELKKDAYWRSEGGCLDPMTRYQCGIYLCLLLGFDTGQRISNLAHRRSTRNEDHCVQTGDVAFSFTSSTLSPEAYGEVNKTCCDWKDECNRSQLLGDDVAVVPMELE
jgi:hypothetical protein